MGIDAIFHRESHLESSYSANLKFASDDMNRPGMRSIPEVIIGWQAIAAVGAWHGRAKWDERAAGSLTPRNFS
jgi:hypothetical protein